MRRYNHAYEVAFSLVSDHPEGEDVTPVMLRNALMSRIEELDNRNEWTEAVGAPYDTYEVDEPILVMTVVKLGTKEPVTWYFEGLNGLPEAIEIANRHHAGWHLAPADKRPADETPNDLKRFNRWITA